MVFSPITKRTHHYLSHNELLVHLLGEYSPKILDIREQYPLLPWLEPQQDAKKLGIKYPIIPGTNTPAVLTTDLLFSLRESDGVRLLAISVKLTKDLTPRNLEKLLLEKIYWKRRGIAWTLVTEKNIPIIRAKNLLFFEQAFRTDDAKESGISSRDFASAFERACIADTPYKLALDRTCAAFGVDRSLGHNILGHAIWTRDSRVDIDGHILTHDGPVQLRNI